MVSVLSRRLRGLPCVPADFAGPLLAWRDALVVVVFMRWLRAEGARSQKSLE
jgi:hypothetical protein